MEDLRVDLVLAGWLVGWWLLWRVPKLVARGADDAVPAPSCSVVVPARDEAGTIGLLLASLERQQRPPDQIIVVDDQSTDATASIARAHGRVTLVAGAPLEPGWTGKSWACHQGVAAATGEVLVFLDADVVLAPEALGSLLGEHERSGGLLSVQPFHRVERAYEQLSAMFNIVGFMGVGSASPGREGAARGAFGPCLVTARDAYDRVGGHASVRADVVEDLALARRYAASGEPVRTLGGGSLVSFRMYPGGPASLLEGWSKNMAIGARSLPLARLVAIGWWVTSCLMTVQLLLGAAIGQPSLGRPTAVMLAALFAVQWAAMLRQLGSFSWVTALAYPVPLVAFVVVCIRSAYLTIVRREVRWRGRTVPVTTSR